jgi:hypothetical protein
MAIGWYRPVWLAAMNETAANGGRYGSMLPTHCSG